MTQTQYDEWYYNLPILTYGEITDEWLENAFMIILQWKRDQVFISEEIPNNIFTINEYWLLLGLLTNCIEYGTSPRGAWLTKLGEEVLSYLEERYV